MSDHGDDLPEGVGFGRPPPEHQFRKGKSGNPRGRPRKPARVFAPRQIRRDILSVTEAPTTIQTATGAITVPTVVAVLMVARKKALGGHGPSIRLLLDRHNLAIASHWDLDRGAPLGVDTLEKRVRLSEREQDEAAILKKLKRSRRQK